MANAGEVYELLSKFATVTNEPITYKHLEALTGVPGRFQGSMLKAIQKRCAAEGEPDLTSMVVATLTGEVAEGHGGGDPARERRRCYEFHSARAKAAKG